MVFFSTEYIHKYDIRGKVSTKFGPEQAYLIGKAFSQVIRLRGKNGNSVVVGCDVRSSGPSMLEALMRGFLDSGMYVINLGICTTPMLKFGSLINNVSAGTMVTASHNPLDQNGFKFSLNGQPFYDQGLQELHAIIQNKDFIQGIGRYVEQSVAGLYISNLLKNYPLGLVQGNINWIANNWYIKTLLADLLDKIPGNHIISEKIGSVEAELTFDFDTDADRMMLYDSKLRQWHGDEIIAFYAVNMKKAYPNLKIILDLKCSRVLTEWLRSQGISCQISRVGSCFIDHKLRKTNSQLGGETSGHFMFADYNDFSDDGIHSALRVMSYLSRANCRIEAFQQIMPQIHVSRTIKVVCYQNKFEVLEQIRSKLLAEDLQVCENEENAILVQSMEGWYIIRTSQTENMISVRCEGFKKETLDILLNKVDRIFAAVGLNIW